MTETIPYEQNAVKVCALTLQHISHQLQDAVTRKIIEKLLKANWYVFKAVHVEVFGDFAAYRATDPHHSFYCVDNTDINNNS